MKSRILTLLLLLAQNEQIRVDTFDTRGNRTGYTIIDRNTGRVDHFDTRSNRTGHGYIHPPPGPNTTAPSDVELFDRNGRRVPTERRR